MDNNRCKCVISNRNGAHQYESEHWQQIKFCPLHAAAPALLAALENLDKYSNLIPFVAARAAIAAAKGEST